jgi:hypothetical protein
MIGAMRKSSQLSRDEGCGLAVGLLVPLVVAVVVEGFAFYARQTRGPEEPDTVSMRRYESGRGLEVRFTPGVVAGEIWNGRIKGFGFPPGETAYSIWCWGGGYKSFDAARCDYSARTVVGSDDAGNIKSPKLRRIPTDSEGGCAIVGTNGPDLKFGTGDEVGLLVCYELR